MKKQNNWVAWAGVIAVICTLLAGATSLYINIKKIRTKNWN